MHECSALVSSGAGHCTQEHSTGRPHNTNSSVRRRRRPRAPASHRSPHSRSGSVQAAGGQCPVHARNGEHSLLQ
jgi:hypothetical protein